LVETRDSESIRDLFSGLLAGRERLRRRGMTETAQDRSESWAALRDAAVKETPGARTRAKRMNGIAAGRYTK
jgi:hypothetical protein